MRNQSITYEKICLKLLILFIIVMSIAIVILQKPYQNKPIILTHIDSQHLIFKAGYLLGADRQKDGFDVTLIWKLDSTLFFDKYIKK